MQYQHQFAIFICNININLQYSCNNSISLQYSCVSLNDSCKSSVSLLYSYTVCNTHIQQQRQFALFIYSLQYSYTTASSVCTIHVATASICNTVVITSAYYSSSSSICLRHSYIIYQQRQLTLLMQNQQHQFCTIHITK